MGILFCVESVLFSLEIIEVLELRNISSQRKYQNIYETLFAVFWNTLQSNSLKKELFKVLLSIMFI